MNEAVKRSWGEYRVVSDFIHQDTHIKTKILTVSPRRRLSMQRHSKRSEVWTILQGTAVLETLHSDQTLSRMIVEENDTVTIREREWHRLCNETDDSLTVHEVQYGSECVESDIERIDV